MLRTWSALPLLAVYGNVAKKAQIHTQPPIFTILLLSSKFPPRLPFVLCLLTEFAILQTRPFPAAHWSLTGPREEGILQVEEAEP